MADSESRTPLSNTGDPQPEDPNAAFAKKFTYIFLIILSTPLIAYAFFAAVYGEVPPLLLMVLYYECSLMALILISVAIRLTVQLFLPVLAARPRSRTSQPVIAGNQTDQNLPQAQVDHPNPPRADTGLGLKSKLFMIFQLALLSGGYIFFILPIRDPWDWIWTVLQILFSAAAMNVALLIHPIALFPTRATARPVPVLETKLPQVVATKPPYRYPKLLYFIIPFIDASVVYGAWLLSNRPPPTPRNVSIDVLVQVVSIGLRTLAALRALLLLVYLMFIVFLPLLYCIMVLCTVMLRLLKIRPINDPGVVDLERNGETAEFPAEKGPEV